MSNRKARGAQERRGLSRVTAGETKRYEVSQGTQRNGKSPQYRGKRLCSRKVPTVVRERGKCTIKRENVTARCKQKHNDWKGVDGLHEEGKE